MKEKLIKIFSVIILVFIAFNLGYALGEKHAEEEAKEYIEGMVKVMDETN